MRASDDIAFEAAKAVVEHDPDDGAVSLTIPTAIPLASGFLWNQAMLVRVNCRGYARAQFLQPEPSAYSHGPVLEATTFEQPELGLYSQHPGRFVYVRDDDSGALFSLPYAPMRTAHDTFRFTVSDERIGWTIHHGSLTFEWQVRLASSDTVERWELHILNAGQRKRRLSVFPVFSIGYMSWMNQSAGFEPHLNAIIARSVPPYQHLRDHEAAMAAKSTTFLAASRTPDSYETVHAIFEGDGGLHAPDALSNDTLGCNEAAYESPIAAMQFRETLRPGATAALSFVFGPAGDDEDVARLVARYIRGGDTTDVGSAKRRPQAITAIQTPAASFDQFVTHWLPRQIDYHGTLNRLTTDPQTRNYLQDGLGQVFIAPERARAVILKTLAQQEPSGGLPDGILLTDDAELKYINQVPHTDHAVWLPILLNTYIDETGDHDILDVTVRCESHEASVFERTESALNALLDNLDDRSLSLIAQGDWCDPMNMVGHRGQGVSAWLSMATIYALKLWQDVLVATKRTTRAQHWQDAADRIQQAVKSHFWADRWFARGITDDGRRFGTEDDAEGQIFLNPQSWALMAGLVDGEERDAIISAVNDKLLTPFGPEMLAPPYTQFVDDIGRLTQKHPGYAENGSVYCHAAMFYVYGLYEQQQSDAAFDVLMRCLPGVRDQDPIARGQLPVFLPNYYRGAVDAFPRTAGRSSQLFNTGAVSWLYRIVIEQLFGLRGTSDGLIVAPQLPSQWSSASVTRHFRDAVVRVRYQRGGRVLRTFLNNELQENNQLTGLQPGKTYDVEVHVPEEKE
ncbi:MAG: NdvB protein [Pseudomonadota bacterium]